jgi:putative phage-type endonuclease
MRIVNLDQRSEEWEQWRTAGIGGSDASSIMRVSSYTSYEELLRKKRTQLKCRHWRTKRHGGLSTPGNAAMARGVNLEPEARELYTALTGLKASPVCVIHDTRDWQRASLDGLTEDHQICLEIKCVKFDYHVLAVAGEVPPEYRPQVQHQLMVTGCPVCHYFSYSKSNRVDLMNRAALIQVLPDPEYQKELLAAEEEFWYQVCHGPERDGGGEGENECNG